MAKILVNGVSVIVLDFLKHTYINDALKSICSQSLNRELFECIIITDNVRNIETNQLIESSIHFKIIKDNPKSPLINLLNALKYCKFDIVSIIDNDDEWYQCKLEYIYNYFSCDASIIAIKDSFELIYPDDKFDLLKKINFKFRFYTKLKNKDTLFNKESFKINDLVGLGLWHNNSTYSIKKDILLKYRDLLYKIKYNTDVVLLFMLLTDGGNILAVSKVLTKFRLGGGSSSIIISRNDDSSLNKYELADIYMGTFFKPLIYDSHNLDILLLFNLYRLSFLYSYANKHLIDDKSINKFSYSLSLFLVSKNISILIGFFVYRLRRVLLTLAL